MAEQSFRGFLNFTYKKWLEDMLEANPYSDMLPNSFKKQGIEGLTPDFLKNNKIKNPINNSFNSYLSLIIDTSSNNSNSNNSSSNNSNNPKDFSSSSNLIPLTIIKATIQESLEDLFIIECEGYLESMQEDLFNSLQTNFYPHSSNNTNDKTNSSLNSSSKDLNFHPKVLIDRFATFIINNPYPSKTIEFNKQDNNSTPSNNTKTYQGIISYVKYLGINEIAPLNINSINSHTKTLNYKHFFSFKMQSPLIRLSFNKANRIYTHINIIEAIKQTLSFYQGRLGKEIDFSNIYYNYEDKELISQYQESDLDFIKRISHNHGIFFYEDASKIYFCDHYIKNIPKSLKYNPNPNNILNEPCISSFSKEESIYPNVFIHSSIQSHTPLNLLSLQSSKAPYEIHLNNKATYHEHTYESEYSFSQSIDLKTSPSLKERRIITLQESIQANSNIYHLSLGEFIKLEDSSLANSKEEDKDKNAFLKDFVIIANTQTLIDDAILTNSINTNDNTPLKDLKLNRSYSNTLSILPSHLIFTPSFKEKPKAPLNTQGIVIGESKEIQSERNTIYTDQYGRVKVRINLYANQEEIDEKEGLYHHTPFLRVATNIASNHSGFYHTPRVGDEVIVSFLDDDIDKPYVSSSLYNGTTTMPQYNYPRYKREIATNTLTYLSAVPTMIDKGLDTLKLQEDTNYTLNSTNNHYLTLANSTIGVDNTDAKARNEITLKNDKDKEEIYILAQKDYKEEIGNNYEQTIKNNKTSEVGALYTEFITLGHMQNIIGFKNVNVGAEYLENTLLSKDTNVGLNNTLNVGVDNKVRVAKNSSEFVGENKDIEIGANQNTIIHKDEIKNVRGNRKDILEGSWDIKANKDINISSKSNYSLSIVDNIDFYTDDCLKLSSIKQTTLNNQDLLINTKEQTIIKANKKIQLSIGEAKIQSNGKEILLQIGSSKIIIRNSGISIQGKVNIGE